MTTLNFYMLTFQTECSSKPYDHRTGKPIKFGTVHYWAYDYIKRLIYIITVGLTWYTVGSQQIFYRYR